jgi:hypothetical protein
MGRLSEPQANASTAPPRPRRRPAFAIFFGLAIVALLVGAGFFAWEQMAHRLAVEPEIAQVRRDIAALRNDVQALDARVTALQKSPPSSDLAAQLDALKARIDETEGALSRTADRDAIATLQTRVARLESGSPSEMLQTAAATLARASLSRAAQTSASFKPEWEALRAAAPDDPAVGALQPFADVSVLTRASLVASFPEMARAALAADRQDTNGNFAARLWTRLSGLISVRRVGNLQGNTTEDRLARAQADMDRGDLSGAVKETQAVTGPAAAPLDNWLRSAEARLAVDSAVLDMDTRIIQALAAAPAVP